MGGPVLQPDRVRAVQAPNSPVPGLDGAADQRDGRSHSTTGEKPTRPKHPQADLDRPGHPKHQPDRTPSELIRAPPRRGHDPSPFLGIKASTTHGIIQAVITGTDGLLPALLEEWPWNAGWPLS